MKTAAVIGCGKFREGDKHGWAIGHAHARGFLTAFPEVELCGVDIDRDNLAAFGKAFGVPNDRLFESTEALYAALTPDAVSIATWPRLHHPQVLEAAGHGVRAIACEKPMALDGSEIEEMIAVCSEKNVRLAVNHQRRHDPWFTQAKKLIAQGVIGDKLVVNGHVGDGWDILSWTTHWFDMASYLLDDQPVGVLAGVDHIGTRLYGQAVEDSSIVQVDYEGGAKAVFISHDEAGPFGFGVHIVGERGMMQVSEGREAVHVMTEDGFTAYPIDAEIEAELSGFAGLLYELWQGVEDPSATVRCGAEHTALATRTAYAAHESARTMRRVALPVRNMEYAPLEIVQHPPMQPKLVRKAVLLADDHHVDEFGVSGRDGLLEALRAEVAEEIHLVPVEKREPQAEDFADADLLVMYHTIQTSTPEIRELIGDWMKSGKPMLITHCGIGAYADWPWFREQIGRYWVWSGEDLPPSTHPHIPCELSVVPGSGFDLGFETAWLPRDEVYMSLGTVKPVRELVTAQTPQGEAYIAWQAQGCDRVMVWAPGHRPEIWKLDVMRKGLRASAAWILP